MPHDFDYKIVMKERDLFNLFVAGYFFSEFGNSVELAFFSLFYTGDASQWYCEILLPISIFIVDNEIAVG